LERSDDALVAGALAGSLADFDRLMLRYQALVCKVALNYVRDRESALDVTQNVFLKAYRGLERVTEPGMFKPWLLRITYNESINWLRRHRRDASTEPIDDASVATAQQPPQEQQVLGRETQGLVLQAMQALNPKYKLAVALRYAEGMRIREIADVMDCSEGMVKSLLFRGVRQLRNAMADAP